MTTIDAARPIFNWAGSKFAIAAAQLLQFVPPKFKSYHEPFAGSLSMFSCMDMCGKNVYINDMNSQVILTYLQVKKDPNALIRFLTKLENQLTLKNAKSYECGKELFLDIRKKFNLAVTSNKQYDMLKIAGMFIFLVQLSFGSLIYINKNGEYASGYRAKSSGVRKVLRPDAIHNLHRLLNCNKTVLTQHDFEECLKKTKRGDFVYLDPPYWSDIKIIKYTAGGFPKEDHIRLSRIVDELTKKGCFVLISYGNHPWIRRLYKKYNIVLIDVYRCAHQTSGKMAKELVITNYNIFDGVSECITVP